jgi:hypothetical protein
MNYKMTEFPLLVDKEEKVNFVYDFLTDSTYTMLILADNSKKGSGKSMATEAAATLLGDQLEHLRIHHFQGDRKRAFINKKTGQLKLICYVPSLDDRWIALAEDWSAKVALFEYNEQV